MLPKPEKNKKNSATAEQLSLVDPVKKENNLKRKRLYVGLTLGFTVILSIAFSAYRYFKNNNLDIHIPLSLSSSRTSSALSPDKAIADILNSEKNIWYIYAQDLSSNYVFNWSQNKADFAPGQEKIQLELDQLRQASGNSHLLDSTLPGGVTYVDAKSNQNSDLIYTTLLSVPNKQIFVYLKVSDGSNLDQVIIDKNISQVVEKIYWSIINLPAN